MPCLPQTLALTWHLLLLQDPRGSLVTPIHVSWVGMICHPSTPFAYVAVQTTSSVRKSPCFFSLVPLGLFSEKDSKGALCPSANFTGPRCCQPSCHWRCWPAPLDQASVQLIPGEVFSRLTSCALIFGGSLCVQLCYRRMELCVCTEGNGSHVNYWRFCCTGNSSFRPRGFIYIRMDTRILKWWLTIPVFHPIIPSDRSVSFSPTPAVRSPCIKPTCTRKANACAMNFHGFWGLRTGHPSLLSQIDGSFSKSFPAQSSPSLKSW